MELHALGATVQNLKCQYCQKLFAVDTKIKREDEKRALEVAKANVKAHEKFCNPKCWRCSEQFDTHAELEKHFDLSTEHEGKYHCEFCPQDFTHEDALSQHHQWCGLHPLTPTKFAENTALFPELHEVVLAESDGELTPEPHFQEDEGTAHDPSKPENKKTWLINGDFYCYTPRCGQRTWHSSAISMIIRGYQDHGYSANLFLQRCGGCHEFGMLVPEQKEYAEGILYHLKNWAGLESVIPDRKRANREHISALCDGCRQGICDADKQRHVRRGFVRRRQGMVRICPVTGLPA